MSTTTLPERRAPDSDTARRRLIDAARSAGRTGEPCWWRVYDVCTVARVERCTVHKWVWQAKRVRRDPNSSRAALLATFPEHAHKEGREVVYDAVEVLTWLERNERVDPDTGEAIRPNPAYGRPRGPRRRR